MREKSEIRVDLVRALDEAADERLARLGFKRRRASDDYVRRTAQSIQTIVFRPTYNPRLYPEYELHLYPHIRIEMPAVGTKAQQLIGEAGWPPLSTSGLVVNNPIAFYGPRRGGSWYSTGGGQIRTCVIESIAFIDKWVIAHLDALQTPADLVKHYEIQIVTEHPSDQSDWYVYVAAAYLLTGDGVAARHVLKKHLDAPHLRPRQTAALKYLERSTADKTNA